MRDGGRGKGVHPQGTGPSRAHGAWGSAAGGVGGQMDLRGAHATVNLAGGASIIYPTTQKVSKICQGNNVTGSVYTVDHCCVMPCGILSNLSISSAKFPPQEPELASCTPCR